MLSATGNPFVLVPDEPAPKIQHDLKELRAFHSGMIKDRTGIVNRLKGKTLSITSRQSKTRLAQVDTQVAEIGAEVDRRIPASNTLAHSLKTLRSISGIGADCVATILREMPEIGRIDRKQVASLTGLAPMTRQSGQWRGQSFFQAGRNIVRDALHAALRAMRHIPWFKAKYQTMIKAGKSPKVALTALMSKLINLANALVKADRNWMKKRA